MYNKTLVDFSPAQSESENPQRQKSGHADHASPTYQSSSLLLIQPAPDIQAVLANSGAYSKLRVSWPCSLILEDSMHGVLLLLLETLLIYHFFCRNSTLLFPSLDRRTSEETGWPLHHRWISRLPIFKSAAKEPKQFQSVLLLGLTKYQTRTLLASLLALAISANSGNWTDRRKPGDFTQLYKSVIPYYFKNLVSK